MASLQEESYNRTKCVLSGEDTEISTTIKVLISFDYIIIVILGSFLHYGIAYYDFNGGDSQKRGLLNQLLSYMSLEAIFHLFTQMTSILARVLFGPMNDTLSKVLTSIQIICMMNLILVFSEQITNRHMKIQKWKFKTKLSVDFWVRFYFIMNHCIGFFIVAIQLYLGEIDKFLVYQILSGNIECQTLIPR